jgi:hypothetical protein
MSGNRKDNNQNGRAFFKMEGFGGPKFQGEAILYSSILR